MTLSSKFKRIPDIVEQYAILSADPSQAWRLGIRREDVAGNRQPIHRIGASAIDFLRQRMSQTSRKVGTIVIY